MPFAFRAMLHERVGGFIELNEPDAIERNLGLLAHHFWHSENLRKKREYLRRAGDAAQAAYANAAAIDYFERLAPLVEQGERVEVLLKLGKVLELVGDWRRAEEVDGEALALAESLGDVYWRASCADGARRGGAQAGALRRGVRAARPRGDGVRGDSATRPASARCCTSSARWRRSGATTRRRSTNYEASLAIRERLDDKASMGSLLSNLGVIAEYQRRLRRVARVPRARAGAAHRHRRPLGDRRVDDQPRDDRRAAEALRRGARLVPAVDAAQSRGRRRLDGRDLPQQPRQRDARPRRLRRRRGSTTPTACARTATTTTAGRWRSCSRTSASSPALSGDVPTALRADRRGRRAARRDRDAARADARAGDREPARRGRDGPVGRASGRRCARGAARSTSRPPSTLALELCERPTSFE